MTTYIYVGPTSAGLADGTSWANRYGTLNAAEDRPIVADTVVYVGPGTYRELLTCDVSGAAGQTINYVGDYDGSHTDGVGGVVRITGADSPDQTTGARFHCIGTNGKSYRTFRGFTLDGNAFRCIYDANAGTDVTIDECLMVVSALSTYAVMVDAGAGQERWTVSNCVFILPPSSYGVYFAAVAARVGAHAVTNCVFVGGDRGYSVWSTRVGFTVKNCLFTGAGTGIRCGTDIDGAAPVTVTNCMFDRLFVGVQSVDANDLIENYNSFHNCNTARTTVGVGANSIAYPWLPDTRWFHEATNGGRFVTPFDMASYCALVNVAGTSPTATDVRGTAVQGAEREIGALEYDSTLLIESAAGGGGMLKADKRGGKQ